MYNSKQLFRFLIAIFLIFWMPQILAQQNDRVGVVAHIIGDDNTAAATYLKTM